LLNSAKATFLLFSVHWLKQKAMIPMMYILKHLLSDLADGRHRIELIAKFQYGSLDTGAKR
jgi:hypothetical protein